jgi:hypothetical protein
MEGKMVMFNVSEEDFVNIADGKKWFLVVYKPDCTIEIDDIAGFEHPDIVGKVAKLITSIDTLGMSKGYLIVGFGLKD